MSRRFSRSIAITGSVSVGFALGSILAFAQTWSRPVNAPPLLNAGQPPAGVQYADFLLKSPTTLQTLQGRITAANVSSVKVGAGGVNSSIGLSAVNSFSAPAYPSGSIGLFSYDQGSSYSLFAAAGGTGSASALVGKADTGGTAGKFVGPVTVSENGSALGTVAVDGAATTTVGLKCLESAGCNWPGSATTILVGTNTAGGTAVYSYSSNNAAISASIARTGGSWATGAAYGYSQYGYGLGGSGSTGVYASAVGSNTTIGLAGFLDTGSGLEIPQERKGVYGLSSGGMGNAVTYTASPPNYDFPAGIRACVKDATGVVVNKEGVYGSGGRFAGYFDGATQCTGATTVTVDWETEVGAYNSIAVPPATVSNRYPFISYYDYTTGILNLKVIKCGDDACTTSTNIMNSPDTDGDVGGYTDVVIPADGFPFVTYYDYTNNKLKALKCGNEDCSSGNSKVNIFDLTGYTYYGYRGLALGSDGLPVLAFRADSTKQEMWVIKCTNSKCDDAISASTKTKLAQTVYSLDLAVIPGGNPVIFYKSTSNDVYYLKCGNSACSSGNATPVRIDGGGPFTAGLNAVIAIGTDNKPIMVYERMDVSPKILKAAKCTLDDTCVGGVVVSTIDPNALVNLPSSIGIVVPADGRPIIALDESQVGGTLDVQRCVDVNCSATTLVRRLSVLKTRYESIALSSDGYPVISHSNGVGLDALDDLLVTKCYDLDCTESSCTIQGGTVMVAGTGAVAPTKGAVLKIGNTYLTKCNLIGMLRKAGYTQYSACP